MSDENGTGLGGKFWLTFVAGAIGCFFAGIVLFLIIGNAWARWGFLGMFLFLAAVSLAIGWFMDRKRARRYDSLGDAS